MIRQIFYRALGWNGVETIIRNLVNQEMSGAMVGPSECFIFVLYLLWIYDCCVLFLVLQCVYWWILTVLYLVVDVLYLLCIWNCFVFPFCMQLWHKQVVWGMVFRQDVCITDGSRQGSKPPVVLMAFPPMLWRLSILHLILNTKHTPERRMLVLNGI